MGWPARGLFHPVASCASYPINHVDWQTGGVAAEGEDIQLELEFDWSAADTVETQTATQFLVQLGIPAGDKPDGVVLIVGHVNPPVIAGRNEASRNEQARRYEGKLPVAVHGRYHLSRVRLEELRVALDVLAKRYDAFDESRGEPDA